jgi:hypothetical protein
MRSRNIVVVSLAVVLAGAGVGALVGRGLGQTSPPPGQTAPAPAQPAPLPPGHPPAGQTPPMPPGHPPTGRPGPMPTIPAPSEAPTGARALTWTAPAAWTKESPASPMRRAQYRIPGPAGAGECVVFYFGPGQGGDAKANVARWASQFRSGKGNGAVQAKTREIKVSGIPVTMVEVAGTYVGGMGSGPTGAERSDYMMLAAIAEGPDANWFFRVMGPKQTVEAQRGAFDKMIKSIKRGGAGA